MVANRSEKEMSKRLGTIRTKKEVKRVLTGFKTRNGISLGKYAPRTDAREEENRQGGG